MVFISKFKILNFFLRIEAFVWTFHIDFFITNDEWRHHICEVACNCSHLYSLGSLSFWSRWLPLFVEWKPLVMYMYNDVIHHLYWRSQCETFRWKPLQAKRNLRSWIWIWNYGKELSWEMFGRLWMVSNIWDWMVHTAQGAIRVMVQVFTPKD